MRFTLLSHNDNTDSILINPKTAENWRIPARGMLRYGLRSIQCKFETNENIGEMQISLPKLIVSYLGLPLGNQYELAVQNQEICIGPFIGILVGSLAAKNKIALNKYSRYYDQLGGTLVAFPLRGVKRKFIDGFMYNAETKQWHATRFPYPASIFRRVSLRWGHILFSAYGDKIANQRGFDKWMVYENLRTISAIKDGLPETALFNEVQDIHHFLQRHRDIYVKPVRGLSGIGIMKISQENNFYLVQWREGKGTVKSSRLNTSELDIFLHKKLRKQEYIIQQRIPLMSYKDSLIDFRSMMAKNAKGEWHDFGLIGKYGKPGSIVSNISSGGKAEMGEATLKRVWKLPDREVHRLRQRISGFALEVVKGMEISFGVPYGDLALDLGIDRNGKIWLVEVNGMGDHTIALDARNQQVYYDIMQANLLYAKKLAGFEQA